MNRCGNCHWLITRQGRPYYCAIKALYTFRDELDEACEDYLEGDKNEDLSKNRPLTVGDLREIIKDLKDNTRIIIFSGEGTFSDEPKIYIDAKEGCKYKKVLIIEE